MSLTHEKVCIVLSIGDCDVGFIFGQFKTLVKILTVRIINCANFHVSATIISEGLADYSTRYRVIVR